MKGDGGGRSGTCYHAIHGSRCRKARTHLSDSNTIQAATPNPNLIFKPNPDPIRKPRCNPIPVTSSRPDPNHNTIFTITMTLTLTTFHLRGSSQEQTLCSAFPILSGRRLSSRCQLGLGLGLELGSGLGLGLGLGCDTLAYELGSAELAV